LEARRSVVIAIRTVIPPSIGRRAERIAPRRAVRVHRPFAARVRVVVPLRGPVVQLRAAAYGSKLSWAGRPLVIGRERIANNEPITPWILWILFDLSLVELQQRTTYRKQMPISWNHSILYGQFVR